MSPGRIRSTKHHGPTVRRPFVGRTRSTPIRPIVAERPSRTSIALMPKLGRDFVPNSSTGPLIRSDSPFVFAETLENG